MRRTTSLKDLNKEPYISKKTGRFESPPTLDPQACNNDFEPRSNQRKRNIAQLLKKARELEDRHRGKEINKKQKTSPLRLAKNSPARLTPRRDSRSGNKNKENIDDQRRPINKYQFVQRKEADVQRIGSDSLLRANSELQYLRKIQKSPSQPLRDRRQHSGHSSNSQSLISQYSTGK